jgi:hypothetical protein
MRGTDPVMKKARFSPGLEWLEDRCTPATWGTPWPNSEHMTLSFVPDGTKVGTQTSSLFSLLNAETPTASWQTTILKAVQTWAVNADINVGVVADGGQPLGTPGLVQGDSRFGDIRVAAVDLGPDVVAVSSPFDFTAGTWAGDVELNSRYLNATSGYDLFTVALHEAGHVFGFADNSDPTSVMYSQYAGIKTGLSSNDVANLLALYPQRAADASGSATGHGSFATATPVALGLQANGAVAAVVNGDLTSQSDQDVYSFTAPQITSWTITLQTSGVSFLESKLAVYDARGNLLSATVSSNPLSGDLQITLNGLAAQKTYYIVVQSNSADVFGMGAYNLNVQTLPLVNTVTTGLFGTLQSTTSTLTNSLVHTNSSFSTATNLPQQYAQVDAHLDYAHQATLSFSGENDFYKVKAPQSPTGQPEVMTVLLWGQGSQGLLPTAQVFDVNDNAASSQILVNDNGMLVLQILNAAPGATYCVEVSAAQPSGAHNVGNYFLGVDFGLQATTLNTLTQGTLSASQPQAQGTLQINNSRLFHFVLSAGSGNACVTMTITDSSGNVVMTLASASGQTTSADAFLDLGTYTVTVSATASGSTPPSVDYAVFLSTSDDQIGPRAADTTGAPGGASSPTSGSGSGSTSTAGSSSGSGTTSSSGSSSTYTYTNKTTVQATEPASDPSTTG